MALTKQQDVEFEEILKAHGGVITDEELLVAVEDRGEASGLYKIVFSCDDGEAARRYRLVQCAWIIRHSRFKFHAEGNATPLPTRRVMNVERKSGTVYMATERALQKEQYRSQLLDECREELHEWWNKWGALLGFKVLRRTLETTTNSLVTKAEAAE